MTTKVWLDGHTFDLEDLAEYLTKGPVQVRRDQDRFFLTGPEIEQPPEGSNSFAEARKLLPVVNGVGRLRHGGSFRPVSLTGQYEVGPNTHAVVLADSIRLRGRVGMAIVTVDGVARPPSPPASGACYAELAVTHPHVAEVLQLLATQPCDWVALYKVFEIIRDDLRPMKLEQSGLVSPSDLSAFTASANNPNVSGTAARHARHSGGTPRRVMNLDQAVALITRMAQDWMDGMVP